MTQKTKQKAISHTSKGSTFPTTLGTFVARSPPLTIFASSFLSFAKVPAEVGCVPYLWDQLVFLSKGGQGTTTPID